MTLDGPMEPPGADTALQLARAALASEPAGLLSDVDGTLAPIMSDPHRVRAVPGATAALTDLAARLAVVGLVSGRAARDVREIMGSSALLVVGNHGLEWLDPDTQAPRNPQTGPDVVERLDAALRAVPDEPGVSAEHKGLSATIHFRNAADPAAAGRRVRAALKAAVDPGSLALRSGRMSLELRPVGAGDKGTAVRAIVERHGLRGLVVLGDDVTDLDMFRAAAELRDAGQLQAAIIGVAGGREVPEEVRDAADALLPDPESVVELLRRLP